MRLFGVAVVIYLLGDSAPGLLEAASLTREYVLALFLALVTVPWVASQFDN